MTNYATYLDVERLKFGTTGKSFTVAQQTTVTALITQCHGAIVGYLGTEPTSTDNLIQIEAEMCRNMLWNIENPSERPYPILTEGLAKRLDRTTTKKVYTTTLRGD